MGARVDLLGAVSEKDFQATVLTLAGLAGWEFRYHTKDSRGSEAGFPDLTLLRPPELIVVELKVGKNQPSPVQQKWLAAFKECGVEAHVWWPTDWDEIEDRLRRPNPGATSPTEQGATHEVVPTG